jgi:putative SOS response-associated peptidase YedK
MQGGITRMCERFTQHYDWNEIQDLYELTVRKPSIDMRPRYKISPATMIETVRLVDGKPVFEPMRWGLVPNWWLMGTEPTNPAAFHTHVETVASISFFRCSFKRRHCLIPASGYYQSRDTPDGKQPYYFSRRDGPVMTIAGMWDEWRHPDTRELIRSCTMMIGTPNKFAAGWRDHMPVILEPAQFQPWLSASAGTELLKPVGERMLKRHPVSKRLNRSRTSDADETLIEKVVLPAGGSLGARPALEIQGDERMPPGKSGGRDALKVRGHD